MATTRHRIEVTLFDGPERIETDVVATYEVDWGRAATREDPEEPAEVHSVSVLTINGKAGDWGTYWGDAHYREAVEDRLTNEIVDELLEHAANEVAAERERTAPHD